jgi:hypothetical protein
MYDDAGFIVLSMISVIAIAVCLAALLWAAVQDGRDEQAFRRRSGLRSTLGQAGGSARGSRVGPTGGA